MKKNNFAINILTFVLLFLFVANTIKNSDFSSTTSLDDNQYWTLGTHLALTGTYGVNKEDSQLLSKEFAPLENRGIRRGEVLYPAYLATIINVFLNEMDKSQLTSNCIYNINTKNCKPLLTAVYFANLIIFISFLMFLILFIFQDSFIGLYKFLTVGILIFAFPTYSKDSLTYVLLSFFCYFYFYKKYKFAYLILSLLPLINAVFYYFLYVFMSFELMKKIRSKKFEYKALVIIIVLLPSLFWSFRNYYNSDQFTIASRGPQLLTIRAEFLNESFDNLKDSYFWYTPSNIITKNLKLAVLDRSETLSETRSLYDRGDSKCIVCKRYSSDGYVLGQLKKIYGEDNKDLAEILSKNNYLDVNRSMYSISINTIKENPLKQLFVTSIFAYRGLFPEFRKISFNDLNLLNISIEIFSSFLRLTFFPFLFYKIFKFLKYKKFEILYYPLFSLFIFLFAFYSFFTHFIPRYSVIFIPFFIYYFLTNKV